MLAVADPPLEARFGSASVEETSSGDETSDFEDLEAEAAMAVLLGWLVGVWLSFLLRRFR